MPAPARRGDVGPPVSAVVLVRIDESLVRGFLERLTQLRYYRSGNLRLLLQMLLHLFLTCL